MSVPAKKRATSRSYFKQCWEEYFFMEKNGKSKCLICGRLLNVFKKHNIQRHYVAHHAKNYEHLSHEQRMEEVQKLKIKAEAEIDEVDKVYYESTVGASYHVALEIAKSLRPLSDGDFVKTCLLKAAEQLCPSDVDKFEAISLSRATIARRMKEMVCNIQVQLDKIAENFKGFSLALENMEISGAQQIAIFIRGVDNDLHVTEELLDLMALMENTSSENIFLCVEEAVESRNLDWNKLVSVATDGSPTMVENSTGFISRLRKKLQDVGVPHKVAAIHSLIHRQNLCAKSEELSNVLSVIVRTTNYIRNHGQKCPQFYPFTHEMDAEYGTLPYHAEIRCLSRGKLLDKFFTLRDEIATFMELMARPAPELRDPQWVMDLAFLSDIVDHLSVLHSSLQEKGKLITELYDSIQAFTRKTQLWIAQLGAKNICHFPKLQSVATDGINFQKYINSLETLNEEFKFRFHDTFDLETDFKLFTAPFSIPIESVPPRLQLELIDIKYDRMLKDKFNRVGCLVDFYKHLSRDNFPQLHYCAARILTMFGSTYTCEQLLANTRRTKPINRTKISSLKSSLILNTSQCIVPNITELLDQKKKLQKSRRLVNTE